MAQGFLSLTGLWPEGCGIALGHACGVKVQKVLKVRKFDAASGCEGCGLPPKGGNEYKVSVTG